MKERQKREIYLHKIFYTNKQIFLGFYFYRITEKFQSHGKMAKFLRAKKIDLKKQVNSKFTSHTYKNIVKAKT